MRGSREKSLNIQENDPIKSIESKNAKDLSFGEDTLEPDQKS
jgi:hypothetical protein